MSSAAVVRKHLLHSRCKVKTLEGFSHPGALGVSEYMLGGGLHSGACSPALLVHRENTGETFPPGGRLKGISGRT